MAGIRFTDEQVSLLRSNPCVKSVTPKYISFTKEFMEEFIDQHSKGRTRYEIFESHGLSVDVLGKSSIEHVTDNWTRKADKSIALFDERRCYLSTIKDASTNDIVPEIEDHVDYYNNWRPQAGLRRRTRVEFRDCLLAKPISLSVSQRPPVFLTCP